MPFVYILRCADDSLYVGHTDNLAARERIHNDGFGSPTPQRVVRFRWCMQKEHQTVYGAIARERLGRTHDAIRQSAFTWRDLLKLNLTWAES